MVKKRQTNSTNTTIKSYSELIKLPTFEERFDYLKIPGGHGVASDTLGYYRYLCQEFYQSVEWHRIKNHVIVRDNACDLGILDYPVSDRILVHHLHTLTVDDFLNRTEYLLDPEFMITTCHKTHNLIHWGSENTERPYTIIERRAGDTLLW